MKRLLLCISIIGSFASAMDNINLLYSSDSDDESAACLHQPMRGGTFGVGEHDLGRVLDRDDETIAALLLRNEPVHVQPQERPLDSIEIHIE